MPKKDTGSIGNRDHTEMTLASNIAELMNEIIKNENLPFGRAEVEARTPGDIKRADIVLYKSPTSRKVVCVVECKLPYETVLGNAVLEQAFEYAKSERFNAPYFCTCNGKSLAWFETKVVENGGGGSITRGFLDTFELSQIRNINHISTRDRIDIRSGLRNFLIALDEHFNHNKRVPLKGFNEFLIIRLHMSIEDLFVHYFDLVEQKAEGDRRFAERLREWFAEQEWSFTYSRQDFEVVARQAAYLLVNKIILYSALQQHWRLDKLEIPPDLKRGGKLMDILTAYFKDVLKIDYETIFSTDGIDIGFPESEDAVDVVRVLVEDLNRYSLVNIGYDVIGYIFERLIPKDERHKLGQYFTPAEVVDLMLVFCSSKHTDKILDPAVGAGTFLVRSYQYKKLESYKTTHEDLLSLLWGSDIVQFPAHLTAINLAVRGLDSRRNFPRVVTRDFFRLTPDTLSFRLPIVSNASPDEGIWEASIDHKEEKAGLFDVVIGNPPYTRQEYLGDLRRSETYKEDLIKNALTLSDGTKLADLSKRAALYAYFFIHGYKFLKEGGRMAFITSNSWLDAGYGSGLQEFLLNNFKIIAIMESDTERWFPGVAVDTCIVVLEKCSGTKQAPERNENLVHFIRFHVHLVPEFVSIARDDEQSQRMRFDKLKRLKQLIETRTEFQDDTDLRIYPKLQGELVEEGTDIDRKVYVGSRWSKFTTAPQVFYKLVEGLQQKIATLSALANIRYGLKTGANEFFYLTEDEIKRSHIEKDFWGEITDGEFVPNYVMKSPTESEAIVLDISQLKLRVLLFHKSQEALTGTHAWSYIEGGMRKAFNERPTCQQRNTEGNENEDEKKLSKERSFTYGWYDLGELPRTNILWPKLSSSSRKRRIFLSSIPVIANDKLYAVHPYDPTCEIALVAAANSTLADFFGEFASQSYGGFRAPSDLTINEARKLLVPDIRLLTSEQQNRLEEAFHRYSTRKLGSLRQEYGIEETNTLSLDKIQPDLRAIDKIFMEELLGLEEREQIEIYKTVFELAENRFHKAKSGEIQNRGVLKNGIDEEAFISTVVSNAEEDIIKVNTLYRNIIANKETMVAKVLPQEPFRGKPQLENTLWGYKLTLGTSSEYYQQYSIALYLQAWALVRVATIRVPLQMDQLVDEAAELVASVTELIDVVESYTSKLVDRKMRKLLESRIWNEIKKQLVDTSLPDE